MDAESLLVRPILVVDQNQNQLGFSFGSKLVLVLFFLDPLGAPKPKRKGGADQISRLLTDLAGQIGSTASLNQYAPEGWGEEEREYEGLRGKVAEKSGEFFQ